MNVIRPLCSLSFVMLLSMSQVISAQPPSAPVFVHTMALEEFSERIEALGTLRANEAVTISATVTDTISELHFDDGKRVEQGEILVEMTDNQEHAQLASAKAKTDEAERQYERVKKLVTSGLSSESLLDQRRREWQAAEAEFQATRSQLKDRLILAPFAGVLGLREVSIGTLVRPGDTIATLDDDSIMKLDITLPSAFIDVVEPGLKINARALDLSDQIFSGEISSIDSRVVVRTRSIRVRAKLPNENKVLRPGMLMAVEFRRQPKPSLLLPEEALLQFGTEQFVYKIDEKNIARRQAVITGARSKGKIVILEGLNIGDKVVTEGLLRLREGTAVNILQRTFDNAAETADEAS